MDDDMVIRKAHEECWVLITNDKDFGEMIYRERRPHHGVVFLRLDDERSANKIRTLERLIGAYSTMLTDHFVVVTELRVRFGKQQA